MPVLPDIPAVENSTTLDQLVRRTRDFLGEPEPNFYDDDADIIPALNAGKDILFSDLDALPRTWTDTTVQGAVSLPAPEGFSRWISVRHADGTPLVFVNQLDYAALKAETGKPTSYVPDVLDAGGSPVIVLYPTPNLAYTLEGSYYAIPSDMTAELGPTWHRRFHYLVCYYAASVLLHRDNKHDEAQAHELTWERGKVDYRDWLARKAPYREYTMAQMSKGEM